MLRLPIVLALFSLQLIAEPIRVQQPQGAAQGFLTIRDADGKQIGTGSVMQTVHGGRVSSRVVYRLNDGSVDSEDTIYTQAGVFHVVSDHHSQEGPFFDKALDIQFETATGIVTTKNTDKSELKEQEKDFPRDIANGITGTILLNLKPSQSPLQLSIVAPTSKGRLIKLEVSAEGEGDFTITGLRKRASIYRIHPQLGGVAGAVAPVLGKQPRDVMVWVLQGEAPALVREITQLFVGGPMLSIELPGTHFEPLEPETKH